MNNMLYVSIRDHLLEEIKKKNDDDLLPSQAALGRMFQASHLTVRKAFDELENAGLLYRIQGKGAFVRKRSKKKHINILVLLPYYWKRTSLFMDLVSGMVDQSARERTGVSIVSYPENIQDTREIFESFTFDGVIGAFANENENKVLREFASKGFRVMILNRVLKNQRFSYVSTDHHKGAYDIASYFLKRGHKRIGVVGMVDNAPHLTQRFQGVCDAMKQQGLTFPGDCLITVNETSGKRFIARCETLLKKMLKTRKPSALFLTGMQFHSPVFSVVRAMKLKVPDDIEIATYDELPDDHEFKLIVHEVVQPFFEIGAKAIRSMERMLAGEESIVRVIMPPKCRIKTLQ